MDLILSLSILCILILAFILFSILVPRFLRLSITLLSSVFQLHTIPVLGVYPSLTLLGGIALWPDFLRHCRVLKWWPMRFLFCMIVVHALSLLWSIDIRLGIRSLVYLLPFLTIFVVSYSLGCRNPSDVHNLLAWFAVLVLVEAALVLLFRFNPAVEEVFLRSPYARFFITPNILEVLFDTGRNNVLDPAKSGGFFVNANVAAGFLGMSAFVTWGVGLAHRVRWLQLVAVLLWVAVFFTGSKAGMILAVSFSFAGYFVFKSISRRLTLNHVNIILLLLSVFCVAFAVGLPYLTTSNFAHRSAETLGVRSFIWLHAWQEFLANPLLGQGFGGWQQSYSIYAAKVGIQEGLPPHNTLIYLWSQSGLLATLFGFAFMVSIMWFGWRAARMGSTEVRALALGTTFAFLWVFVQGMGTNWGIVGEIHMQPMLAACLGLTYARYRKTLGLQGGNFA